MAYTDEQMAAYVALDNAVAVFTTDNWMPSMIEDDYRRARHTEYYASWYQDLSEREKSIADEINMRL